MHVCELLVNGHYRLTTRGVGWMVEKWVDRGRRGAGWQAVSCHLDLADAVLEVVQSTRAKDVLRALHYVADMAIEALEAVEDSPACRIPKHKTAEALIKEGERQHE